MILRVKAGTVQLPHTISRAGVQYQFAPDADLPDDYANALLKTSPHLYEEAKGDADLNLYSFTDQFKNKSIADIVSKLSDEDKLKVFNFAKAIALGEPQADEGPAPQPLGPDEMQIVEIYRNPSADRTIEVVDQEELDLLNIFRKLSAGDKAAVLKYSSKKE